ncbi:signal peptide containing protein [Theileria equi strain WA]|uniref:Signal peptide containing protein n=1 Tax=Theileria equi strain WA TaxID=1537102 RepID=L1LAB9_THEEQ|nr:signal peptide containing protein [Theileria equi strain WA]EKX72205.1 signal peptide containing protein [Theileria equi strain WA]|eukprot:XP_004831657.1 signal peptide containing protein [Theileria equi strain WA]
MNVFFILVATCLLGLCDCSRSGFPADRLYIQVLDDYVEDDIANEFPKKRQRIRLFSSKRMVWDMADGTVYKKSKILPGTDDTAMLNIGHPNRLLHKSFSYSFAGNAIQLVVPKKGVAVIKLVNFRSDIWDARPGEELAYVKVYLDQYRKPELILVVTNASDTVKEHYLELRDEEWVDCTGVHEERMKELMDPAQWISNFQIDLSASKNTKECTIFETVVLGISTKHFYPKPGHLLTGIRDKDILLWESSKPFYKSGNKVMWSGKYDDRCLCCLIYRKGSTRLLELTLLENSSGIGRYFEKNADGEWNEIDVNTFDKKARYIRGGITVDSILSKVDGSLSLLSWNLWKKMSDFIN